MTTTPDVLCRQLARHWAAQTINGYTYCEPSDSAPHNLYSCPLPRKDHRKNPAASITLTPSASTPPNVNLHAIDLVVEARAMTDAGALAMLTDLVRILWPDDGVFILHAEHFGQRVDGVPGIPANGAGDVWLWRVVNLEPQTGPVVVPGGGRSEIRGREGEAVATMTIGAACAPTLIDWWE